jgi:hypothetical protein
MMEHQSPKDRSEVDESFKARRTTLETLSTDRARQGRRGRHVLVILISALILVAIAWAGVEMYGKSIAPPSDQTTAEPAG